MGWFFFALPYGQKSRESYKLLRYADFVRVRGHFNLVDFSPAAGPGGYGGAGAGIGSPCPTGRNLVNLINYCATRFLSECGVTLIL